jgi:hypothetical protein
MWRDVLQVFSIEISFAQIGNSLEMSMDVPWPSAYSSWMKNLGFANFDLLSMLGMTCLPGMNYELQFVSSTLMVVAIVAVVAIQYCLKASALKKQLEHISEEQKLVAAHHVFDTVDIDESGTIDPEEFELCLNHIATEKHELTPNEITESMLKLGAKIPKGEFLPVLDRSAFVRAVLANKLGKGDSTSWIKFLETDKLKSAYISIAVQVMLLCHAPTTKRVLYYFNAQHLEGADGTTRSFLKVDYSMEMGAPRWNTFLSFVLVTLVCYSIALPAYIIYALCKARKDLWSPRELTKYGFLYARFHKGAEGWEIHELVQKNLLCGVVGFLPPTVQAPVAIIVCIIAIANLNYFQPPRNKVCMIVLETAFFTTTFKYLAAVLLTSGIESENDKEIMGIFLVSLDLTVMVFGVIGSAYVMYEFMKTYQDDVVKAEAKERRLTQAIANTSVLPISKGEEVNEEDMTAEMKEELKGWKVA